jgi:hypothetical protein
MFQSRKWYISLLGAVAWSTTAADTILDIMDASSLSPPRNSSTGLAAAASAFDILALGAVTLYSSQYARSREGIVKHSRQARRILAMCCIGISATALIISLASMVYIRTRLKKLSISNPDVDRDTRLTAQIVFWTLTCLSQSALYTTPLWNKSAPEVEKVDISDPRDSVMSDSRESNPTQNPYMLQPTQTASPMAVLLSPTLSAHSSQSLKSWRQSLRPAGSRSNLLKQKSLQSMYSVCHSTASASQTDGFDTWEAEPQHEQLALQLGAVIPPLISPQFPRAPTKGTSLDVIPQSRSASPAHFLDGPFPDENGDQYPTLPPPKMVLDTSRPPSPVVSEANIHPLFRNESAIPPPAATPGTSIIASPLADRMFTCPTRQYSEMRSSSARSRTTFTEQIPSRSTSPFSREMTPPIPDFVLDSTPRSSLSHSHRKVSLLVDTNINPA